MAARSVASVTAMRSGSPRQRHHDGNLDAGVDVGLHRRVDVAGVADHVDGVDESVAHGRQRSLPVLGRVPLSDGVDLVAEAGAAEVGGVGVDDGVGEQVAAGELDAVVALGDTDVYVGVDGGVAAGPHLLDRPRHVRGRQVVEEHPVGDLAGEAQHPRVEGADDDLRAPTLGQPHAEAEPAHLVEVALEGDRLAAEALLHEGHVLADPGQGPLAVGDAVPLLGHDRRGDADAEDDVDAGVQRLQRGAGHGDDHRRAQLEGQHAGAEPELGRGRAGRGQHGEGLRAGRLRRPEAAVAELRRPGRRPRAPASAAATSATRT